MILKKVILLSIRNKGEINFCVLGRSGNIYAPLYWSRILIFIAERKSVSFLSVEFFVFLDKAMFVT